MNFVFCAKQSPILSCFLSDSYLDTTKKERVFRKSISAQLQRKFKNTFLYLYKTKKAVRLSTFLFM